MAGEDGLVEEVWRQQSIWSQTANRMKASIGRTRSAALALTVGGAVLATLVTRLSATQATASSVLAIMAAVAVGLAPVLRPWCTGRVLRGLDAGPVRVRSPKKRDLPISGARWRIPRRRTRPPAAEGQPTGPSTRQQICCGTALTSNQSSERCPTSTTMHRVCRCESTAKSTVITGLGPDTCKSGYVSFVA